MADLMPALRRIGLAALASLAVAILGSLTWTPLLIANALVSPQIPWSVPVEGIALVLIWRYLNGWWWPASSSTTRQQLLRARAVPVRVFLWAEVAGGLALVALAGLWVVLVEMTGVGGNPTLPTTGAYPELLVVLAIVMGSLVSPLTEEAAFRGYGQVLLERSFSPVAAVAMSSLFFALYHGPTQGFALSKIFFYFVVGLVFGGVAHVTDSVLPAIPVHIGGDLLFFTLIWPNDGTRPQLWSSAPDPMFWVYSAQVAVFGILAVIAFAVLLQSTRTTPKTCLR